MPLPRRRFSGPVFSGKPSFSLMPKDPAKRNVAIAIAVVGVFALWMLTGLFGGDEQAAEATNPQAESARPSVVVQAVPLETYQRTVVIIGETAADARALIAAQTEGRVQQTFAEPGATVQAGDPLLALNPATRQADLTAAKAQLAAAKALYEGGVALEAEGYLSPVTLAQRKADYAAAQQRVASIEQDLSYTRIAAPIAGTVQRKAVSTGDFVTVGQTVYELIGNQAFLVVGFVAQEDRNRVQEGAQVTAQLVDGQRLQGTVRGVALAAEEDSRSYRTEVVIDGAAGKVPVGMSARIDIPTDQTRALFAPHAWLVLNDAGDVGLMLAQPTADEDNESGEAGFAATARFVALDVLEDTPQGLWLGNLPAELEAQSSVMVITRGQATLGSGSQVRATAQPTQTSAQASASQQQEQ